eukprot:gene3726-7405_t
MNRIFGKKKEAVPTISLGDATTGINTRISSIDEKIKGLDNELRKFNAQIKLAKDPTKKSIQRRALETLKRKKMYEQQRDQMAGQAFNIEQTAFAIESVKDTQLTLAAMKVATVQLKIENKKMNINEIEDMQDDLQDMFEDMEEVNELMGRSYNVGGIDDLDLESELACLGDELDADELTEEQPSYLQSNANLPIAPSNMSMPQANTAVQPPAPMNAQNLPVNGEMHLY